MSLQLVDDLPEQFSVESADTILVYGGPTYIYHVEQDQIVAKQINITTFDFIDKYHIVGFAQHQLIIAYRNHNSIWVLSSFDFDAQCETGMKRRVFPSTSGIHLTRNNLFGFNYYDANKMLFCAALDLSILKDDADLNCIIAAQPYQQAHHKNYPRLLTHYNDMVCYGLVESTGELFIIKDANTVQLVRIAVGLPVWDKDHAIKQAADTRMPQCMTSERHIYFVYYTGLYCIDLQTCMCQLVFENVSLQEPIYNLFAVHGQVYLATENDLFKYVPASTLGTAMLIEQHFTDVQVQE